MNFYSKQEFIKIQKHGNKRANNVTKKTNKMNVLGFDQDKIKKQLIPSKMETLKILLYLIAECKTVQISKLADYFPLPIIHFTLFYTDIAKSFT